MKDLPILEYETKEEKLFVSSKRMLSVTRENEQKASIRFPARPDLAITK
jgi:hypothetical protein